MEEGEASEHEPPVSEDDTPHQDILSVDNDKANAHEIALERHV